MEDVRIVFDGSVGTHIDLTQRVSGKNLYMQKACVNIATSAATDKLYPERGTDILTAALNGLILDPMTATHYGNFAALDTLNFINWQEYETVQDSPDLINDINIEIKSFSIEGDQVDYNIDFLFADDTTARQTNKIRYI